MENNLALRIKAWFIKMYRYFFIPKINSYPVPKGERLFEMNLLTGEVNKAEYRNYNGEKIFVRNKNCIYEHAINERNAKIKFDTIINKAIKRETNG